MSSGYKNCTIQHQNKFSSTLSQTVTAYSCRINFNETTMTFRLVKYVTEFAFISRSYFPYDSLNHITIYLLPETNLHWLSSAFTSTLNIKIRRCGMFAK